MELSECSRVGLSKVRLTGRKLLPRLVVMEYTSPIPAQGKVVLSFALTFPGGFLNPDIVPVNTCHCLASPLSCFSYVFWRDGTAEAGPVSIASSVHTQARADIQEALVRKRSSGRESSPDSDGVVAEAAAAADTYKTRCYQRAVRCRFEKGHSLAFKCWYGLVLRREKTDLKGDKS